MAAISRGPTLGEQVYENLRTRIINGEFRPGRVLSESELAQELQVSRTPVSNALTILVERGLLEQNNGKIAVPVLSIKDLVDLFTCRLALDGLAARLAAAVITDADLERLERHLQVWENPSLENDLYALWVADLGFHEAIYQLTGNRHLVRFGQIAAELAAVYRKNTIRRLDSAATRARSRDDVRHEHREIFEALAKHDADAAEAASRRHIANVIAHLEELEVIEVPGDREETE